MRNKDKPMTQYKPGDQVYHITPQTSLHNTSSSMYKVIYIGQLAVYSIINKFQCIWWTLKAKY